MKLRANKYLLLCFFVLGFLSFSINVNAATCPVDSEYGTLRWMDGADGLSTIEGLVDDFTYTSWVRPAEEGEPMVSFIYAGYMYLARNGMYEGDGPNGTWHYGAGTGSFGVSYRFQPRETYLGLQAPVAIPPGVQAFLKGKKIKEVTLTYISYGVMNQLFEGIGYYGKTAYGYSVLNDDGTINPKPGNTIAGRRDALTVVQYGVQAANMDLLKGGYNSTTVNVIYNINGLTTNMVNDGSPGKLANGMGYNLKQQSWDPGCVEAAKGDLTMAMVMYLPFFVNFTYEEACDYKAATDRNNAEFKTYWDSARRSSTTQYKPSEFMMECTCAEEAGVDFKGLIDNRRGGSLSKWISRSLLYRVDCDDFVDPDACTLENYEEGNMSDDAIAQCCISDPDIFTDEMCPQDTTFDLYCNDNLMDTKIYINYQDELKNDDNRACKINCTEIGTATFLPAPFVIAGQGFDYSWDFDDQRVCVATYKFLPDAWASTYNDMVDKRVDAYAEYMEWVDTRDPYTSDEPPCSCSEWEESCTTELDGSESCDTYCVAWGPCTVSDTPDDDTLKIGTYDRRVRSLRTIYNNLYADEKDFLRDKNNCDNWSNRYSLNSDFSIEIYEGENGDYTSYDMAERLEKDENNVYNVSKEDEDLQDCPAKALDLGDCSWDYNVDTYSIWYNRTVYNAEYTLPEEQYIDRITYQKTSTEPEFYYQNPVSIYAYYTDLGTLTGKYDILVKMNNDGFGAYEKFKLKSDKMVCWYDLSNELAPEDEDDNWPIYGDLGVVFRTVTLTDLFPGRKPGSNWASRTTLITSIETKNDKLYDEDPLYVVVLTPENMEDIRSYVDKQGQSYGDWYKFEFGEPDSTDGTSGFLKAIDTYSTYNIMPSAYESAIRRNAVN